MVRLEVADELLRFREEGVKLQETPVGTVGQFKDTVALNPPTGVG
jgi:hypothetical protein